MFHGTTKTLYTDSKILYNVGSICTNVPIWLEIEFITTEIQFNIKVFGDEHCRCKEVDSTLEAPLQMFPLRTKNLCDSQLHMYSYPVNP